MHCRLLIIASLFSAFSVTAADRSHWEFHGGWARISGLKLGRVAGVDTAPSLAPRADRNYADGFNRVDATGNLGDGPGGILDSRTGYFSFQRDNQVDLATDTLTLNSITATTDAAGIPRPTAGARGWNLGGRWNVRPDAPTWHWGLSGDLDLGNRSRSATNYDEVTPVLLLSDRYALGGVVPQSAPYGGHFTPQPGDQRIGDTPSRTITTTTGRLTGTQNVEYRITLGRIGVWAERQFGAGASVSIESGLANAWVDAAVQRSDTLISGDGISSARAGSSSGKLQMWGWHAGIRFSVRLSGSLHTAIAFSHVDVGENRKAGMILDGSRLTVVDVLARWAF